MAADFVQQIDGGDDIDPAARLLVEGQRLDADFLLNQSNARLQTVAADFPMGAGDLLFRGVDADSVKGGVGARHLRQEPPEEQQDREHGVEVALGEDLQRTAGTSRTLAICSVPRLLWIPVRSGSSDLARVVSLRSSGPSSRQLRAVAAEIEIHCAAHDDIGEPGAVFGQLHAPPHPRTARRSRPDG